MPLACPYNDSSEKSSSEEMHLTLLTMAWPQSIRRPKIFLKDLSVYFRIHAADKATEAQREEMIWLRPPDSARRQAKT